MSVDVVTDVVVVGSGAAGSAAALAAARSGLSVLQLEKTEVLGGTTAESYGHVWVPGFVAADDAAVAQDVDEAVVYLRHLSAGYLDEDVARAYCSAVLAAVRFLSECGLAFEPLPNVPDHHYPVAPGSRPGGRVQSAVLFDARRLGDLQPVLGVSQYVPRGLSWNEVEARGGLASADAWDQAGWPEGRAAGDFRGFGMGLAGALLRAGLDSGVELRLGHRVVRLTVDDGRVSGCDVEVATGDGGAPQRLRISARRGVVLATGGIEGDRDMVLALEDLPDWQSHYPAGINGDGMVLATGAGGGLRRNRNGFRQMMGYRIPAHQGKPPGFRVAGIREMAAPHTLVVNRHGRRFADESRFQHVAAAIRRFDAERYEHPNYPCYLVMDRAFFQDHSFAGRPHGAAPPDWLASGDTPAELASLLGIDADGFSDELEQFNAAARDGVDPVFQRGSAGFSRLLGSPAGSSNANLAPVDSPPFYGVPLVPTGPASIAIRTDGHGQVLSLRGEPVEGLYAAGSAAPTVDTGPAYQSGLALGQGLAMGCAIGWALALQ